MQLKPDSKFGLLTCQLGLELFLWRELGLDPFHSAWACIFANQALIFGYFPYVTLMISGIVNEIASDMSAIVIASSVK